MRVRATLELEDLIGVMVDRYFQPLTLKVETMSQQVTDLQAAVAGLAQTVSATVANETALKQKLDAAVADNVSKTTLIAELEAQLAAIPQVDPADAAAIIAATSTIQAQTQALADAAAQTAPTN